MEALADALEEANPNVDESNKYEIAEACLELEAAASRDGASECRNLPIFISGRDVREAADHDLESLAFNPGWVKLNRDISGKPGSGWYTNTPPCIRPTPTGKNCHEYPFFSTQQGGPSAQPTPRLKYVDGPQNQLQGTRLSQFYATCGVAPGGDPFLAIPLPLIPINSMSVCNQGG